MMLFSRVSAGQVKVEIEETDLLAILRSVGTLVVALDFAKMAREEVCRAAVKRPEWLRWAVEVPRM